MPTDPATPPPPPGPALTIAEAARATGLTPKALRRRLERGTLPSLLAGDRRRIPMRALLEAGLLVSADRARPGGAPAALAPARPRAPAGAPACAHERELLDRLERQAEEIGRLQETVRTLRAELALARRVTGP